MKVDQISITRIQELHPLIVQPALDAYAEIGCVLTGKAICRIQEGLRTFEKQAEYYALGRNHINPDGRSKAKPMGNIITNSSPGSSFHQYGLALDYVLLVDTNSDTVFDTPKWDATGDYDGDKKADWKEIGEIFKKHGFELGAEFRTFPDLPHVQMTFNYLWADLFVKYKNGDFIPGTKYVFIAPTILVQKALNKAGFRLVEDGLSGKRTISSVKEFQGSTGLKTDGIVDYKTAVKLGIYT